MIEHFRQRLFGGSPVGASQGREQKRIAGIVVAEQELSKAIEQLGNANERKPGDLCQALQTVDEAVGKLAKARVR